LRLPSAVGFLQPHREQRSAEATIVADDLDAEALLAAVLAVGFGWSGDVSVSDP
jgi:hypothetical protein